MIPPVLDAYATTDGLLMVWCAHEARWHTHGRCGSWGPTKECAHARRPMQGVPCTCPTGNGDGHRVEHCTCDGSPYRTTGYMLREIGPYTDTIRRSRKAARASAPCPGAECAQARADKDERAWRYSLGEDVLEAKCPKCHARPGKMCTISRGKVHSTRVDARFAMRRLTSVPR